MVCAGRQLPVGNSRWLQRARQCVAVARSCVAGNEVVPGTSTGRHAGQGTLAWCLPELGSSPGARSSTHRPPRTTHQARRNHSDPCPRPPPIVKRLPGPASLFLLFSHTNLPPKSPIQTAFASTSQHNTRLGEYLAPALHHRQTQVTRSRFRARAIAPSSGLGRAVSALFLVHLVLVQLRAS